MIKNYLPAKTSLFVFLICILGSANLKAQIVQTFTYTVNPLTFLVPNCVTTLTIEAKGAAGGSLTSNGFYAGGNGSTMKGTFTVIPGTLLNVVVGTKGDTSLYTSGGGGASGVGNGSTPLIIAGGGGGVDYQDPTYSGMNSVITTTGVPGNNGGGAGGINGADGGDLMYTPQNISRGGRGWSFNNAGSTGLSGISTTPWARRGSWGLGGGGGSVGEGQCNCGGGGGGYSGGGAGQINTSGGGGGSYNGGTNQVNTAGNNPGDGIVIISYLLNASEISVSVPNNGVICPGGQITLIANGSVPTFTWSPNNFVGNSLIVMPNITSTYTVSGFNSVNNCPSSAVVTVSVMTIPTISVNTSDAFICRGQTATLTATGMGTYAWSNSMTGSVIAVSPTINTTYTVTGNSGPGCDNFTTINIDVDALVLTVTSNTSVCLGKPVLLTASGANDGTYSWAGPNGSIPFQSTSPILNTNATFTASGTNANNCVVTNTVLVTVNPNPTVTASANPTLVCKGKTVILSTGGANTYTWDASTGSATTPTTTVTPLLNTTYNYSVVGSDANGCTGIANVAVKVELCTSIHELQTSNSDISVYPNPSNGNFIIKASSGAKLEIVNELGQIIKKIIVNESNEVSVQGLSKGIYLIIGENNGLKINKNIIIH